MLSLWGAGPVLAFDEAFAEDKYSRALFGDQGGLTGSYNRFLGIRPTERYRQYVELTRSGGPYMQYVGLR